MRIARPSSTLRRLATIRARMPGCSHFDSSKTKALTMCCCSPGVWLIQNCRAWLKWSAKRSERTRCFGPASGDGNVWNPPTGSSRGPPSDHELGS